MWDVAIAGAHGKVARRLSKLLARRGDRVRGFVRDPEQATDLRVDGAEPIVLDLEYTDAEALAPGLEGCDAVVFAAGAGPGSEAQRKESVDYGAAVTLMEAAQAAGVPRYVMVSAIGAADPPDGDDVFAVYLRAKARADRALMDSDLAWTIVRPGGLTDDPATGRVDAGERVGHAAIPRDDAAAVLAAVIDEPRTAGVVFNVVGGDTPVAEAVARLARPQD